MRAKATIYFLSVIVTLANMCQFCRAQNAPNPADNAALQYYSAFLQMQDADLNDDQAKALEAMMSGQPYDESRFGRLMDGNTQAIETMIVGSELPYCDWGLSRLDARFGPATPVPYFWRSRVLWKLDYLYVLRLSSQGKQEEAVHALVAGLKFGRHVANGGPLVPAMIAMVILRQQLALADRLLDAGKLTAAQKEELRTTLDGLGSDGIDWQSAVNVEMRGLKTDLDFVKARPNQSQYYKMILNADPPSDFRGITPQDYADLEKIARAYAGMFHDSNPAPVLQAMAVATPAVQAWIPNPKKVLDSRDVVRKAISDTRARLGK